MTQHTLGRSFMFSILAVRAPWRDSGEKSCKEKFDIVLQPRLVDHGAHYSFILLEEVLW